ncbi:MAG: primosomal protein, partial [Clostridia bacterium]|nr:primosomal protein [Clostridia bacterium]
PIYENTVVLNENNADNYLNSIKKDADGNLPKRFFKQKQVIDILKNSPGISVKELMFLTAVGKSVIDNLEKHGVLNFNKVEAFRNPLSDKIQSIDYDKNIELNDEQEKAYTEIKANFNSGKTHLLYGVTGSGKTHVFMSLINAVLEEGKSALMLIPEISLTFQIVSLFYSRYGNKLAILHSGLSNGERLDEWRRIKNGSATVVVGTRSAVFAPLKDLGIIIIDEEQANTYKSEMNPRYHAREVAVFKAVQEKALLVLASATPSFESFYRAQNETIGFSCLLKRFNSHPLPKVLVSDMRSEMMSGNTLIISNLLAKEINENIKKKEQSILFMNRRGYSSFVACQKCGKVIKCPNCGIALTYHNTNNKLVCHYCNYFENVSKNCGVCGSSNIKYSGYGTQKVEEELHKIFPELRVLRMDADTVIKKNSRDNIMTAFKNNEYDILLGTQMITKGLDFPNVTLVGVLMADMSLYSSDFKAYERTFSLLTQVTGRAGRAEKAGRAVIQTYSPTHEVLQYSFKQDYENFYKEETALRKSLLYPPFCDICQGIFIAETEVRATEAANFYIDIIKKLVENEYIDIPIKIIKPKTTSVPMVDGKYRVRILIKCKDTRHTRDMLKESLMIFLKDKTVKDVYMNIDINPENIL